MVSWIMQLDHADWIMQIGQRNVTSRQICKQGATEAVAVNVGKQMAYCTASVFPFPLSHTTNIATSDRTASRQVGKGGPIRTVGSETRLGAGWHCKLSDVSGAIRLNEGRLTEAIEPVTCYKGYLLGLDNVKASCHQGWF
jgi:hypothetical protein